MRKTNKSARKALAVFSAAALLMSCGATGFVKSYGNTGIEVNAVANTVATQLKILDENGNDLGDNPIIYLDNSEAAGKDSVYHNVKKTFRVVASNDNGVSVDDEIRFFRDGDAEDFVEINCPERGKEEITATVAGGHGETDSKGETKWTAKNPGTTHLYFTTSSGEVYRSVTIVVYQPATDMRISQGAKGNSLDLNDNNLTNSTNLMVIANHQYQFTAQKVPTNSTDEVEWFVYEGSTYEGQTGVTPSATTKAEITQNGLFTPKKNGNVTIVAKYKATETTPRDYNLGDKKFKYYDDDGKEKTDTVHNYQNVPKYIHVLIVKENPATSLKITNDPRAMEVGDTIQLNYEATPSYTGKGYETGATDVFTWKSSNTKVATVDEKGLVTAVGKGDVKITVTGENDNVRAEVDLKVLTKADSISFQTKTISTRVGVETPITAIMNPTTADEEIEWSSSDESIATVRSIVEGAFSNEQTAVVKGIKKGTVTITARAKNSGVEAKITCNVTKKIDSADINLSTTDGTQITTIYNGTTLKVFDQKSVVITGNLVSADGTSPDDSIVWEVLGNGENNGDYVTIDKTTASSIQLTGFARGIVTVKASSKNNPSLSKSFRLQVLKKATKGSIISNETGTTSFHKVLNVGSTISLSGDIVIESNYPYDHDDRVAHWISSNPSVIEIDDTGFARVVGNGKSTITMVTESGYSLSTSLTGFTTSSVMIKGLTTSADGSLPKTSIALNKLMTGTKTLSTTVKNEKDTAVTDVALEWTSDNPDVATVDANGKVTAHDVGEAVITVKSGNKYDSCIVECDYSLQNATITVENAIYTPFTDSYEPKVTVAETYTSTDILGNSETITLELTEGIDYTLEYSNNTSVGQTGKVTITGLGYYSAVVNKTFKISARPIKEPDVKLDPIDSVELTMNNKSTGAKAEVALYNIGYQLVEGTDYTVTYSGNKAPGTATVTITGKGNYTGKTTGTYEVYCKHGKTTETVKPKATCQSKGLALVKCDICGHTDEKVLPIAEHDFRQTKVVAPTYDSDGYTLYTCSVCKKTEQRDPKPALKRISLAKCTITLSATSFNENGSVQYPKVTVKNGSTVLKELTDYNLTYSNKNSKAAGSYTVKISGLNGYTGVTTKTYTIVAAAKSVKLDKTATGLGVGESVTLKAITDPTSAASSVKWSTSNASVATVVNGKVTGKKAGTATITATAGKVKATCTITVKNAPSSVSLTKTAITLGVGETYSLGSSIPANTAAATRTYSSSNASVVKMTKTNWTGEFKAMKVGTAKVTVKLYNGKTASCTVTVKAAPTSVSLTKSVLTLGVGESFSLGSAIPANTGAAKRTYSSSNSSVIKMTKTDWTGNFTAMKVGTAKVTVRLYNGKTATCTITVRSAPSSVKLNKGNMTLKVGQKSSVAAVLPANTGAAKRTYRTSNASVVQMTKTDWTGEFVAKKVGTAYITVRLYNGKEASIKVTVVK